MSKTKIRSQRAVWCGNLTHVFTCMLANIDLFHEINTGTAIRTKIIFGTKLNPLMKHSLLSTPKWSSIRVELKYSPQNADGFFIEIDCWLAATTLAGMELGECKMEKSDDVLLGSIVLPVLWNDILFDEKCRTICVTVQNHTNSKLPIKSNQRGSGHKTSLYDCIFEKKNGRAW